MKLNEILLKNDVTLSFEVFPPKATANYEAVQRAAYGVAQLKPSYMSVTYGAGGSTRGNTLRIAKGIQETYGVTTIAPLTCVGIRAFGGMCIGGACYPEGHVESENTQEDILNLKKKVDAGCAYLTTQMFFDNNIFYNFLCRVREAGIDVPVIPGIMPITRPSQLQNAVKLSGCNVPMRFRSIVDCFGRNPEAMQQAGIIYATDQIIDLIANGIKHIHVYSMNKPEVVRGIQESLSRII